MAPRALLVVAAVAIAGGIAWFALGRRGSDTTAPAREAAPTATTATPDPARPTAPIAIAQAAPPKPVLPELAHGPALPAGTVPTPPQIYASEPRDPDWGPRTEKEIEHQLAHLKGATLDTTECHVTQCQLTFASGSEQDLQAAIGQLSSKQSLAGIATSMMLTAPDRHEDGSLVLRVFAALPH